jgi:nucleoside-diphosphate-sugar epimerase
VSRILILGGTGFVGPFVVEQLVERGHDVTLFHRGSHEPARVAGARHIHGDFGRLTDHLEELAEVGPEVVIDVSPSIGKSGHGVLHFSGVAARGVVLTSMDVYRAMAVLSGVEQGVQEMPVTEDADLRTGSSPDLDASLAFDNLEVERAAAGARLPVTVLRCPIIYGPLDTQRRLRHYVRRMIDQRPAIVLDDRLARLRLSRGYVENVAAAVVLAALDERAAGVTYNVGEAEALSELEWVRAIGNAVGWRGEVLAVDGALLPAKLQAPLPPQDLYGDTSRMRHDLGYSEPLTQGEGLRRAVEWEQIEQRTEARVDYGAEDDVLRTVAL